MDRSILNFVFIPAIALTTLLGVLFLVAPTALAALAVNSVDVQLVQPWRVGVALLLLALTLLIAAVFLFRETARQDGRAGQAC